MDGTFITEFGIPGKEEGQLLFPRKVGVLHSNGNILVIDRGSERSRLQVNLGAMQDRLVFRALKFKRFLLIKQTILKIFCQNA